MNPIQNVVLSWSGGKDSAMSLYELRRRRDVRVVELLTTVAEPYDRISHHGVRAELLEQQAARSAQDDQNIAVMPGATPVDEATNGEPDQGRAGSFFPWGRRIIRRLRIHRRA